MKTNRNSLVLIAAIFAIVTTALFFVVSVTALFVTAYIFTLLGIAGLLFSGLFLLKNEKSYPWAAALPQTAGIYLITQVIVSAVVVVLEQTSVFKLPFGWLLLIHIAILAFFAVRIIALNVGKTEIERVEEKVKERTFDWKMLVLDVEALVAKSPQIKPVLDAIKYSDPVTNPKIAEYDEKIRDGVAALEQAVDTGDVEKVSEIIVTMQRQIKDRNNRAKLLK